MSNNSIILSLLCKRSGLSYILFTKDFKIIDFDENASLVADDATHLKIGSDIREACWEYIGMEESILNILVGNDSSLKVNMIFKNSKYYNIEIVAIEKFFISQTLRTDINEKVFITYISRKLNFSPQYLQTIQKLNEKTLILQSDEIKVEKEKNYYNLINQNIISFHVDIDGIITKVNSVCVYFLGKDEEDILHNHFSVFFHTKESDFTKSKMFNAIDAKGKNIFFHANIIPIEHNGLVVENIIICQDITHLRRVEKELEYASNHDSLTGLPNRSYLLKKIDEEIKIAKEKNSNFTLCFIDIDNFKSINNNFGNHAGDMLLKHISSILNDSIREFDYVARVGSDKFIVLLKETQNKEYFDSTIQRIKELPKQNPLFYSEDDTITFDFSLGISSYPKNGDSAKSLLDFTNQEICKAKKERQKNSDMSR